jgi:hypothetical protein
LQIPSTTLRHADRTLVVEATPLARSDPHRLGILLDQTDRGVFQIKSPVMRPRFVRVIAISAVFALIATAITVSDWPPVPKLLYLLVYAGWVLLFAIAGYAVAHFVMSRRRVKVSFNSVTGQAWMKDGANETLLVSRRIRAVQLIRSRVDEELRQAHPGFQINLILDGSPSSRLGFITFRDVNWTRQAGQKLADYLRVPLVDQIPPDG